MNDDGGTSSREAPVPATCGCRQQDAAGRHGNQTPDSAQGGGKCAGLTCFARLCCCCGLSSLIAGAALVIVYFLAIYDMIALASDNDDAFSIPGFILLFIGIFFSVVGILLCWVIPARRKRHAMTSQRDADAAEAGFHDVTFSDAIAGGYDNPTDASDDPPPTYDDVGEFPVRLHSVARRHARPPPPDYHVTTKSSSRESSASIATVSGKVAATTMTSQQQQQAPPPCYRHTVIVTHLREIGLIQ